MTDKELICRALLGSREAQQECTEKGIVLPCPFCGGSGDNVALNNNPDNTQFWGYCWGCHTEGPIANGNVKNALSIWNARPAPPIGRCGECKWYEYGKAWYPYCNHPDGLANSVKTTDFCSFFEPKED